MITNEKGLQTVSDPVVNESKNIIESFIVEQFSKLALNENMGLNSRIKRTFSRP